MEVVRPSGYGAALDTISRSRSDRAGSATLDPAVATASGSRAGGCFSAGGGSRCSSQLSPSPSLDVEGSTGTRPRGRAAKIGPLSPEQRGNFASGSRPGRACFSSHACAYASYGQLDRSRSLRGDKLSAGRPICLFGLGREHRHLTITRSRQVLPAASALLRSHCRSCLCGLLNGRSSWWPAGRCPS